MKKVGLLLVILSLVSFIFAGDLFLGVGADLYGVTVSLDDFELDELEVDFEDFSGASVFAQVDLSIFTAQFLLGRYDNSTGEFYQYANPKAALGINLKLPIWIFYLRGQVVSPLSMLENLAKGFINYTDLYLITRLGVGARLSNFFAEVGMSAGSYVAYLNTFNPFDVPYVLIGVAF
ncbi:hypothetical protein [Kosmotoga olearia]|jgi:hypothetical protein|uniref:Uncharacterized protein n=1 Tax=Kosmotoga olearia (strain ATCC BAA-1733 / DSM 21960 / TBF 19.5.1) TaxID=521045 RepID=C5CDF3_KOSOT|nr:hypothetical protein [Kosmotoga olearia]ACR80016.1 hypothetical protein Kole_1322 [Kosmotoga olearia TBF 19.5.1]